MRTTLRNAHVFLRFYLFMAKNVKKTTIILPSCLCLCVYFCGSVDVLRHLQSTRCIRISVPSHCKLLEVRQWQILATFVDTYIYNNVASSNLNCITK